MTTRTKRILIAAAAVLVLMFAWLVWPTPYHYHHVREGSGTYLVRVHRLTGRAQCYLFARGWYPEPESEPAIADAALRELVRERLAAAESLDDQIDRVFFRDEPEAD